MVKKDLIAKLAKANLIVAPAVKNASENNPMAVYKKAYQGKSVGVATKKATDSININASNAKQLKELIEKVNNDPELFGDLQEQEAYQGKTSRLAGGLLGGLSGGIAGSMVGAFAAGKRPMIAYSDKKRKQAVLKVLLGTLAGVGVGGYLGSKAGAKLNEAAPINYSYAIEGKGNGPIELYGDVRRSAIRDLAKEYPSIHKKKK